MTSSAIEAAQFKNFTRLHHRSLRRETPVHPVAGRRQVVCEDLRRAQEQRHQAVALLRRVALGRAQGAPGSRGSQACREGRQRVHTRAIFKTRFYRVFYKFL